MYADRGLAKCIWLPTIRVTPGQREEIGRLTTELQISFGEYMRRLIAADLAQRGKQF